MTAVLPNGYLTILEGADLLSRSMYAGVPDLRGISSRTRDEARSVFQTTELMGASAGGYRTRVSLDLG
jgi:hypothetical protein